VLCTVLLQGWIARLIRPSRFSRASRIATIKIEIPSTTAYQALKRSHTLVLKEVASNVLQIGRVPVSALQAWSGEL
jgi:hypothetical protein